MCEVACLDLSDQGMRLETPEAIPLRSVIRVRGNSPPLEATGSVRYCRARGLKFILGIQFSSITSGTAKARRWD